MSGQFDRLRPRTPRATRAVAPRESPLDAEGKRALFSSASDGASPAGGSVSVECSSCGETTVLSPAQALRAALPSLHLGFSIGRRGSERSLGVVRRSHPSWMRCPACGRRTWVRVTLQV